MSVYYNEIDPFAAAWLRELIKAGHIAPGEVDERSIEDVIPSELMGFSQCHFFAGIGVWSHALRQAGWPDDRPVWTGSCPCQPFSAAGKGGGTSDERHLWPAFFWLIRQCRPNVVFGEQVEAALRHDWLDHVAVDLEAEGYTVGAVSSPACGYGSPHKRSRLYWVSESGCLRQTREPQRRNNNSESEGFDGLRLGIERCSPTRRVADAEHSEWRAQSDRRNDFDAEESGWKQGASVLGERRNAGILGDSGGEGLPEQRSIRRTSCSQVGAVQGQASERTGAPTNGMVYAMQPGSQDREQPTQPVSVERGPTNGFWRDCEWIPCRDGKARPTGRGIHPLVLAHTKSANRRGAGRDDGRCVSERTIKGGGRREIEYANDGDADGPGCEGNGPTQSSHLALAHGPAAGMVYSGDQGAPADEIDPQNTAEARVGRLRGYGNACVAPQAIEFIRAYLEICHQTHREAQGGAQTVKSTSAMGNHLNP